MKKLLTLALTLVALAAFTGLGVAQEETERKQADIEKKVDTEQKVNVEQKGELENLPELQAREAFEVVNVLPTICHRHPIVYLGGKIDNFGGGKDPVATCPTLKQFWAAHPTIPRRQFDEVGPNKALGHSFNINCCKVCAVQVEIKMKAENDYFQNDTINIYGGAITGPNLIWTAPTGATGSGAPGTFVLNRYLPPASISALNKYIFTHDGGECCLNFIAQDDHTFDYVKLTIWYY